MKFLLAIWFTSAAILCAEEITLTTTRGRTIEKATINRVEPDGLILTTDGGVEKVLFSDLSPELQQKYGFNPNAAAQFRNAAQMAAQARAAEAMRDAQAKAVKPEEPKTANAPIGVINSPTAGAIMRPGRMSVTQVASEPFTLKGFIFELIIPKHGSTTSEEISAGKHRVSLSEYGNGSKTLTATIGANEVNVLRSSPTVFAYVSNPARSEIVILGNRMRHNGLSPEPVFYWDR